MDEFQLDTARNTEGDHGDAQLIPHGIIECRACKNRSFWSRALPDGSHDFFIVIESQGTVSRHAHQHIALTTDIERIH